MVRALRAGTKTQTRRVVKPQPHHVDGGVPFGDAPAWAHAEPGSMAMRCPYGKRGDRLWVREAWRVDADFDSVPPRDLHTRFTAVGYEAGGTTLKLENPGKLRPGMFMPRWASRILLEVTGVRVERLQDISEEDAVAEGIELAPGPEPYPVWRHYTDPKSRITPASSSYGTLWESINGRGSWDANPWVWVVEFKGA